MRTIDKYIDNRIIQNIVIWVFVFLISMVSIQSDNILVTAFLIVSFLCFPVYINNLFILPYFFRQKFITATILFIFNIFFWGALGVFILSKQFENFEWRMLLNMSGLLTLILLSSSAIKIARDSFTRRQEEKEAELKLLKAQLNPHFLFNTLNNLYGLAVIKSDKLPELMLTLSNLLRYSLYDTKEKYVQLNKEVQYLEDYISLEKIRLEEKVNVTFRQVGNFEAQQIVPMLLIVFIENAFKHMAVESQGESYVNISLETTEDSLNFTCENSIGPIDYLEQDLEKGKSGIGLENANKRLRLIYPNKHKLHMKKTNDKFTINLKLYFD